MQRPPEQRRPAPLQRAGLQIELLRGTFDDHDDNIRNLQAQRVRARFAMSWPAARAVAEIAFATMEARS